MILGDQIKALALQAKSWVVFFSILLIIGGGIWLGLSKITISTQQNSTQTVQTSQVVQNQNINVVIAGNSWFITNETWTAAPVSLKIVNDLNYYQQTRMRISDGLVYYPIVDAPVKTVTNAVVTSGTNRHSVTIEKPAFLKKWFPGK